MVSVYCLDNKSNMGFDSMAAWDKSSFDFAAYTYGRFDQYTNTPAASPTSRPDNRTPRPGFQQTKSRWSPPQSPTPSRPQSRHNSSPPSPRVDSAFHTSPILHAKDNSTLASQIYAAACAGDIPHITLLHSLNAPLNSPTPVAHLYRAFRPAKPGHLSPLAGAASHHQLAAAQTLLNLGAQINPDLSQSSSSPLHQACIADDIAMVDFLLERGADFNAQNCYRTTPLMYAVKYASTPLISLLLSHGPDLSRVSIMGTSVIHWAILQNTRPGRGVVLQLLLQAGAHVEQRMGDGSTPLHCAALGGLADVVEVLLESGADPGARDGLWQTPGEVAKANGHEETVRVLGRWGG